MPDGQLDATDGHAKRLPQSRRSDTNSNQPSISAPPSEQAAPHAAAKQAVAVGLHRHRDTEELCLGAFIIDTYPKRPSRGHQH
jgi:hypothetical protein